MVGTRIKKKRPPDCSFEIGTARPTHLRREQAANFTHQLGFTQGLRKGTFNTFRVYEQIQPDRKIRRFARAIILTASGGPSILRLALEWIQVPADGM
jgi:hypothetical protein